MFHEVIKSKVVTTLLLIQESLGFTAEFFEKLDMVKVKRVRFLRLMISALCHRVFIAATIIGPARYLLDTLG